MRKQKVVKKQGHIQTAKDILKSSIIKKYGGLFIITDEI